VVGALPGRRGLELSGPLIRTLAARARSPMRKSTSRQSRAREPPQAQSRSGARPHLVELFCDGTSRSRRRQEHSSVHDRKSRQSIPRALLGRALRTPIRVVIRSQRSPGRAAGLRLAPSAAASRPWGDCWFHGGCSVNRRDGVRKCLHNGSTPVAGRRGVSPLRGQRQALGRAAPARTQISIPHGRRPAATDAVG
jgi:hypothetical protein